ncbi:sortase domain-bontaining protein [Labedaea rhizosphaerae]|uniref:Sortase family protein n=1 Tax=Labedaea rhizosphaerae TaxID=598644 RepID=A0A4R6SM34_LABRH|nr:sortase [Labedaea rhizosphaerae]TDQ04223.1 sortase family protein [Labedaea rhizosphaerae]
MRVPKPRPENRPSYVSLAVGVVGVAAVVTTAALITPARAASTPIASAPVAGARGWTQVEEVVPTPSTTSSAKPKPKPAASTSAKPKPHTNVPGKPPSQRPGTVRLAGGGTALLVRTEVGPDGVLPIPVALDQATWWGAELDDRTGATVLAGHINWHGQTGPFNELWRARVDDPVTIVDQRGHTLRFKVVQLVTLHKDELPRRAGELFSQRGAHRLVLVTCGGAWVGGEMGYASNRVVIAEPVR